MGHDNKKHELTHEEKSIIYRRKKAEYSGRPLNPMPEYDKLKTDHPEQVKSYWDGLGSLHTYSK